MNIRRIVIKYQEQLRTYYWLVPHDFHGQVDKKGSKQFTRPSSSLFQLFARASLYGRGRGESGLLD